MAFSATTRGIVLGVFLVCCVIALAVNETVRYRSWLAEEESKQPSRNKIKQILEEHRRYQKRNTQPGDSQDPNQQLKSRR
jgi:hypothetical protein